MSQVPTRGSNVLFTPESSATKAAWGRGVPEEVKYSNEAKNSPTRMAGQMR
jgi:hypothetical protein